MSKYNVYNYIYASSLIHKKQCNKQKKQNKGKEDQKPRNIGRTRTAYQVQNPGPEENIKRLNDKNQNCASNTTTVRTNTICIYITVILKNHDNYC